MATFQGRFKFAQNTAAGWTVANTVLLNGEVGYETDTGKFKIGDGTTAWNSLTDYFNEIPLASTTEILTGTDAAKAATANAIAALWEKGSDIASAGTISVGEGGLFHVTGTTTITDIDPATDKSGRKFALVFDGILLLTHHATTLILPTGANITTAAGDVAIFVSEGSDAVRCVSYMRASGAALAGSGGIGGSTGGTDNAILRADGTGGSTAQGSGATIDDSGNLTINQYLTSASGNNLTIDSQTGQTRFQAATTDVSRVNADKRYLMYSPAFYVVSPAQITANQNDYTLSNEGVVWLLSSDAARDITGFIRNRNGNVNADGDFNIFINKGSFNITLKHESASSTAANRFTNSSGADIVLAPNQGAQLIYLATHSRHQVFKYN